MPYELGCSLCLRTHRLNGIIARCRPYEKRADARAYTVHIKRHVPGSIMNRVKLLRRDSPNKSARRQHSIKMFLNKVRLEWGRCWFRAEGSALPVRHGRLAALHSQASELMQNHSKCTACTILFGQSHNFASYAKGLCEWCFRKYHAVSSA